MGKELKHNSAEKKPKLNKKKIFIIAGAAFAVIAVIITAAVLLINNNKDFTPANKQIKADMNADKSITQIQVGKNTYTFKISSFKKTKELKDPESGIIETYNAWVNISRKSDIYAVEPVEYKVTYIRDGDTMKYKSAETDTEELTFTAVAGVDKAEALKKVQKSYKNAKFKEHKTDLENGKDKVIFTVNDKEYEGTATAIYKFDNKKGWLFKKLDDKKVNFKKGVTHKEDGLYTNSNIKNILFLGIDSNDGSGRSDCMMLISVDSNTGKIKQTSFMRDNWFNIPGYGEDKLNAAYAYGGASLTVSTIENTFGIKIDNYVAVNFSTFKEVINQLGGIDVDITSDEAGYINWQINRNGQAGYIGTISTAGGVTHLNGQQALWLCRDRGGEGFSGNDFTRTSRQRRVIQALVDTYKSYTPAKVLSTINVLKGNVKTNLKSSDFKWFAERSPKFFTYKFKERCVPDDGEWQSGYSSGGAWIIQLYDFAGLKSDVQKFIYEDIK